MYNTQIIARELRHIKTDTGKSGHQYTLWQVIATKPDGTEIEQNLRTFDELPLNEVIEVTVESFQASSGATSYTVKPKRAGLPDSVDDLRLRVEKLESHVFGRTTETPTQAATVTPPPPPPAPPPPTHAVAPQPLPGDDPPF
jgi:hypothetical protein